MFLIDDATVRLQYDHKLSQQFRSVWFNLRQAKMTTMLLFWCKTSHDQLANLDL
jgi:hypothetical protein